MVRVQKSVPTARMGDGKLVMGPKTYKPNHAPLRYSQGYWAGRHLQQEINKAKGIGSSQYKNKLR